MSTLLNKLTSIVKIPLAVYPLKTSVNNSSIRYENETVIFYISSLMRMYDDVGGEMYMVTSDGDVWPLPDDETLIKKILTRVKSNSDMLGKRYKPTMTHSSKNRWLKHKHNEQWHQAYKEEEEILDQEHPVFCVCGSLATGLHTNNCRKWKDAINKRINKRLISLLPTLEPITIPND